MEVCNLFIGATICTNESKRLPDFGATRQSSTRWLSEEQLIVASSVSSGASMSAFFASMSARSTEGTAFALSGSAVGIRAAATIWTREFETLAGLRRHQTMFLTRFEHGTTHCCEFCEFGCYDERSLGTQVRKKHRGHSVSTVRYRRGPLPEGLVMSGVLAANGAVLGVADVFPQVVVAQHAGKTIIILPRANEGEIDDL